MFQKEYDSYGASWADKQLGPILGLRPTHGAGWMGGDDPGIGEDAPPTPTKEEASSLPPVPPHGDGEDELVSELPYKQSYYTAHQEGITLTQAHPWWEKELLGGEGGDTPCAGPEEKSDEEGNLPEWRDPPPQEHRRSGCSTNAPETLTLTQAHAMMFEGSSEGGPSLARRKWASTSR